MAPLAAAYSGPPKLTLARAFTEWRLDVPMLVLILAAAAWYLFSVRKVRRAGGQWGSGRVFAFVVLGLGFWLLATMASPGAYQEVLFYMRATQTVFLTLIAPLFLAMGKPLTLLAEAYPGVGGRVARAVRSRAARIVRSSDSAMPGNASARVMPPSSREPIVTVSARSISCIALCSR